MEITVFKKQKPQKENYVSNKDFTTAVVTYVKEVEEANREGKAEPKIPEYIGECLLKISKGISSRPNFSRYSYREEMVMDGVENCLRALTKFKVDTKTRSGTPNAFAYFTQICWYAFLRRIQKEKRQEEIRQAIIDSGDFSMFAEGGEDSFGYDMDSAVEKVKVRAEKFSDKTREVAAKIKAKRQKTKDEDSSLGYFLV